MALKSKDLNGLPPDLKAQAVQQIARQRKAGAGEPIPKEGRSKYRNVKSEGWDSQQERRRGHALALLARAGEITDLRRQVTVRLGVGKRSMRLDFVYFDVRLGETVWEDHKGFSTTDWLIKKDIWAAGFGPGLLRVHRQGQGSEDIYPAVKIETLRILLRNARRTLTEEALREALENPGESIAPVEREP